MPKKPSKVVDKSQAKLGSFFKKQSRSDCHEALFTAAENEKSSTDDAHPCKKQQSKKRGTPVEPPESLNVKGSVVDLTEEGRQKKKSFGRSFLHTSVISSGGTDLQNIRPHSGSGSSKATTTKSKASAGSSVHRGPIDLSEVGEKTVNFDQCSIGDAVRGSLKRSAEKGSSPACKKTTARCQDAVPGRMRLSKLKGAKLLERLAEEQGKSDTFNNENESGNRAEPAARFDERDAVTSGDNSSLRKCRDKYASDNYEVKHDVALSDLISELRGVEGQGDEGQGDEGQGDDARVDSFRGSDSPSLDCPEDLPQQIKASDASRSPLPLMDTSWESTTREVQNEDDLPSTESNYQVPSSRRLKKRSMSALGKPHSEALHLLPTEVSLCRDDVLLNTLIGEIGEEAANEDSKVKYQKKEVKEAMVDNLIDVTGSDEVTIVTETQFIPSSLLQETPSVLSPSSVHVQTGHVKLPPSSAIGTQLTKIQTPLAGFTSLKSHETTKQSDVSTHRLPTTEITPCTKPGLADSSRSAPCKASEERLVIEETQPLQPVQMRVQADCNQQKQLGDAKACLKSAGQKKGVEKMLPQSLCTDSPQLGLDFIDEQTQAAGGAATLDMSDWGDLDVDTEGEGYSQDSIDAKDGGVFAQKYGRHTVIEKERRDDDDDDSVVLTVRDAFSSATKTCVLTGYWAQTAVEVGDTVNILGDFDQSAVCHISNKANYLIVNPDWLISGTTIVSMVGCPRRSVLNEKFRGCDGTNKYMLFGNIIHSIFQEALDRKLYTEAAIEKISGEILRQPSILNSMYELKMKESLAEEEIRKYTQPMALWMKKHIVGAGNSGKPADVQVCKIVDIEENVWSPRYGVKGKVDVTVDVKITSGRRRERKVIPLEVKTGKSSYSIEHQGQVTLYSMMLSERGEEADTALLLYLKDGGMKEVPTKRGSQTGLIQLRNELCSYLSGSSSRLIPSKGDDLVSGESRLVGLPDPINNETWCSSCPHLMSCSLYSREIERREHSESHVMSRLIPATLSHLTSADMAYFSKWTRLLHIESKTDISRKGGPKDIWMTDSTLLETEGGCIAGLNLTATETLPSGFVVHTFGRSGRPLPLTVFNRGEKIQLSDETGGRVAIASGLISSLSSDTICVNLERPLVEHHTGSSQSQPIAYRADKAHYFQSSSYSLGYVAKLMANGEKSSRLRALMVGGTQPKFAKHIPRSTIQLAKRLLKGMNILQKSAIMKALMCEDYTLIKGYPGSGKTTTICALVELLVKLGKSVLITSYTHSAVDNILLRLLEKGVPFMRCGRSGRIHPDILPYSDEQLVKGMKTVAEVELLYNSKSVVATTCLGASHAVFTRREFDVCIVDEATQILEPATLGPLFCARKFVLVGDTNQLSPVVQSKEARKLGMDVSLFEKLDDHGATFELCEQYRMNSIIMKVCNHLVYNGKLTCASEQLENAVLDIQLDDKVPSEPLWMQRVLSPKLSDSVVFLDTHGTGTRSTIACDTSNQMEADIVKNVVGRLIECGVPGEGIGVISPYQDQLRLLSRSAPSAVEVNTVDQYQGRDKTVIVISFVKANLPIAVGGEVKQSGGILSDNRRLNVAVTRAKRKLIMIGDSASLVSFSPLKNMVSFLRDQSMFVKMEESHSQER